MLTAANYDVDVDEALGDDLDVDGEPDPKKDDAVLTEGRSLWPSTDVIIIVGNPGKCSTV